MHTNICLYRDRLCVYIAQFFSGIIGKNGNTAVKQDSIKREVTCNFWQINEVRIIANYGIASSWIT